MFDVLQTAFLSLFINTLNFSIMFSTLINIKHLSFHLRNAQSSTVEILRTSLLHLCVKNLIFTLEQRKHNNRVTAYGLKSKFTVIKNNFYVKKGFASLFNLRFDLDTKITAVVYRGSNILELLKVVKLN